jgi:TonB-dependent SusC/RagA subfamily outer membrane receptor
MRQKLFVAILLFIFSSARGQDVQKFLEKLQDYNLNNPQEKVYLHTDKPVYSAGENIFFKSYSTIGSANLFSSLSGILYAELISPANKIVQRVTISTPMGIGIGDFTLSDTITEGVYRVRAYTNWMKNAGEDYFFDKKVPIFNGRSDNVITHTTFESREKDVLYKINLSSVTGLPIAKKRISYTINEGDKIVEKRSQTSSEGGLIEISVNNKFINPILRLRFENIDKNVVNKIIRTVDPQLLPITTLFPEGGKLVKGRINTIAVKSINSQGLGISSNVLIKQGADTLGTFETNKLGMGAVSVFLNDVKSLEAYATYPDGSQVAIQTPPVHDSGFSLLVNNLSESKLFAQLNVSADLQDNSDVFFVVHHLGEVLFVSKSKLNKDELVFTVDKQKLSGGVMTISILNNQFQPLIERPIYHHQASSLLKNKVLLNKTSFGVREKVQVEIEVGDGTDATGMGAYSASVIDLSKVNTSQTQEANIISSLLLSNDIKGHIENPNFYFNADGTVKTIELDYLLLTQGWRNIDWSAIGLDVKAKYEPEKSLKISGYTKKIGRNKPEPNAKVQLISTKNFLDYIDTISNEEGYFEFDNLLFPDSVKFLVSAKDAAKGKNNIDITVNLDTPFEIISKTDSPEALWDINSKYLENLKSSKEFFAELERLGIKEKAIQIDEVVVTRQRSKAPDYSSNLNGPGNADQILSADDLSTCPSLEICLAGRLTGVYFQSGVPYNTRGNQPMQVVLDGMYIEGDNLSMVNVMDIESIEVLRNANYTTIYGSNGANGLIVITSKRGSSALNNYVPRGILTVQPQGFQLQKTFYKPAYDVDEALKYNTDLRSTIHWEPAIVTDTSGKAAFDFFTSDSKGKYLLILEGLDLQGRMLRKETEIIVE